MSDAISDPESVAWESPRDAEPAAAPEPAPETPNHEIPEEVESRMGGGFEVSEPPAAPAPPEPPTIPQPTFEATQAAPPSDWFTQTLTNGAPSTTPRLPTEVPEPAPPSAWFNEEEPPQADETSVPQTPPAAPPPTAPPVQAISTAQRGRAVAPGYGGGCGATTGTGASSRARRGGRPEPANHRVA